MNDLLSPRAVVLTLDPSVVIVPAPLQGSGARFSLSSPTAWGSVEASAYQLRLLWSFGSGDDPDEILERYPFEKDESRVFIERCREAGILRPVGVDDRIESPERVPVSPRFCGAPAFDPRAPASFTLLGIPFDGNTTGYPGARFGPAAVRAASEGIRYALDPIGQVPIGFHDFASGRSILGGVTFADAGDVYVSPGEDGPELYGRVTDVVRDLLQLGTIPMVVGGDHSLSAAVLAAFPDHPMQIVHFDAHTDLGEVERSDDTGLHHGNVFSVVLQDLPHVAHIRQVGLRGTIEAGAFADEPRAQRIGMDVFRAQGLDQALQGLDPELSTYVSVDIDVVDPGFAPSTGTPVPGGLFPHELKSCLRAVGQRCRVVGMDIMEIARPIGPADGTASIAVDALLNAADAVCERMLEDLARSRGKDSQ